MNEISILFDNIDNPQLVPLREDLKDNVCAIYSAAQPHSSKVYEANVHLSSLPDRIGGIMGRLAQYHLVPAYWAYWYKKRTLDLIFARKIARDGSSILYTSSLFKTSIKEAKRAGKRIVIREGNSEAKREYERIMAEYNAFGIKSKYVYGDKRFRDCRLECAQNADYVIAITEVSRQTFERAGYDMNRFRLIPSNGTNWPIRINETNSGKQRAFICTAFHNFIKGTHRLLLAWKRAQIEDIPLIIVGRICDDMVEFINKFGPFENVVFMGHQSNLIELYAKYDAVGILLSLSEGAGRVTPEMMSFGFPMITSPDASCDIVKDSFNGFIVEPTDEDAISQKLLYFAHNWERVHDMRNNVLNSVGNWTVKEHSLAIAKYLRSLINAN